MEAEKALMVELPHHGQLAATSLYLPPSTKKSDFLEVIERLSNVGHGYWWWIADASMFGVHRYGPKIIPEIAKVVGCSPEYIRSLARLAQVYPVRDRVPGVSVTHHRAAQRIRVRGKRLALLHRAKVRRLSTQVVVNLARAREKRRLRFMFKVPIHQARDKRFLAALQSFFKTWNVKDWWREGTRRNRKGVGVEGQRQALLG